MCQSHSAKWWKHEDYIIRLYYDYHTKRKNQMIQSIGLTVILRLQYTHPCFIYRLFWGILVFSRYTRLGGIPTYHFSDLASSTVTAVPFKGVKTMKPISFAERLHEKWSKKIQSGAPASYICRVLTPLIGDYNGGYPVLRPFIRAPKKPSIYITIVGHPVGSDLQDDDQANDRKESMANPRAAVSFASLASPCK